MAREERDPYAPPPMHHDRSGVVVRLGILGALVAAAAFGYMSFARNAPPEIAQVEDVAPETAPSQQLAENAQTLPPTPMPQAAPPERTPAPAPRRTAPRPSAPEPVPAPVTRIEPAPITPAPIPAEPTTPAPGVTPPQG